MRNKNLLFALLVPLFTIVLSFPDQSVEAHTSLVQRDTLSDKVRDYAIHLAVKEGLDKNSIKINVNSFGDVTLKDKWGKEVNYNKDIFGNLIVKDKKGNQTTVKKDIFDNLIIEDNKGNRTTVKKDIFDNQIIEDNKGKRTTVKKDIFDNLIIEDNKGNRTTVKKDIFGKIQIDDPKKIIDITQFEIIRKKFDVNFD